MSGVLFLTRSNKITVVSIPAGIARVKIVVTLRGVEIGPFINSTGGGFCTNT
jgi:hypothetical protein